MDNDLPSKDLAVYYDADYFEKDYKKNDKFNYFSNYKEVIESCSQKVSIVNSYIDIQELRILDVGCAAGYFLEAFRRKKPKAIVEGVEISKEAALIAQSHFKIRIVAQDLLSLEGDQLYDVITMFQTLEHLNDPVLYLKQCHKLLKTGWFIFVEVPNFQTVDRFFR